jgi:hypothetical protein
MVIVTLARALWMNFWSLYMLCGWRWLGSSIQLIFDHLLVFVLGRISFHLDSHLHSTANSVCRVPEGIFHRPACLWKRGRM